MKASSSDTSMRQLTIRLPVRLLEDAKALARRRHTSVNELVRSLLEAGAAEEREAELARAYDLLAQDVAGSDVEPFVDAQAEVARHG